MSGGKGGSKTQSTEIPAWAQEIARQNLERAQAMSRVGYQPYYGTDVVGFGPTGDMARQANIDAAIAFGMAPEGTKATPMGDLSSGTLYDQAVAEAARRNPGQEAYYNQFFINPQTGAMPVYEQQRLMQQQMMQQPAGYGPLVRTGMGDTPDVNVSGDPMFTNEEFANFAVNMIPGVATVRSIGDFIDGLSRGSDSNRDNNVSSGGFADDSDPSGGSFGSPSGWD